MVNYAKQPCLLSQSPVMTVRVQSRHTLSRVGHSRDVYSYLVFFFLAFSFFFAHPKQPLSTTLPVPVSPHMSDTKSHILTEEAKESQS